MAAKTEVKLPKPPAAKRSKFDVETRTDVSSTAVDPAVEIRELEEKISVGLDALIAH